MIMTKKQKLPDPVEVEMKPPTYQPSKAEKEEEFDMPGMTDDQVRTAFMRPIKVKNEDS